MNKRVARLRRAKKTRKKIMELCQTRLCVFRSSKHIYVQMISASGDKVLATASTLEKDFKKTGLRGDNIAAACKIGKLISNKAKKLGINKFASDRSGFKYHGRIKALIESVREEGLDI